MKMLHAALTVLVVIVMLSVPGLSMVKESHEYYEEHAVPLELEVISLFGGGGILALIKKKKWVMQKHTFRYEKIDKKLREDNDD